MCHGAPDCPQHIGHAVEWRDELVDLGVGDLKVVVLFDLEFGASVVGADEGVEQWNVDDFVVGSFASGVFRYCLRGSPWSAKSLCWTGIS